MPNLEKIATKIRADYPELQITQGERFRFSPPNHLYYQQTGHPLELLHELGHYLIGKSNYTSDIELVEIESQAWAKAREICPHYGVDYDEEFAESHLDSYRDWLHLTSLCQNCNLSGYQDSSLLYHCPLCGSTWHSRIPPE